MHVNVSIPTGSITVALCAYTFNPSIRFQFQLVRLQSTCYLPAFGRLLPFQFQLVRLQSSTAASAGSASLDVSIPTGSITVKSHFVLSNRFCRFQFQLVRLQWWVRGWRSSRHIVSIPTGSITVKKNMIYITPAQKFQFQLVRLQWFSQRCLPAMPARFNSNWFDYSKRSYKQN